MASGHEVLAPVLSKLGSLELLSRIGLNTPHFIPVTVEGELKYAFTELGKTGRVSVRTQRYVYDFGCPHFPNAEISGALSTQLVNLLHQGYTLIVAEPIDPTQAVARGNAMLETGGDLEKVPVLLEFSLGPGTVRDQPDVDLIQLRRVLNAYHSRLASIRGHSGPIRSKNFERRWGTPLARGLAAATRAMSRLHEFPFRHCVIEWSVYRRPVGRLFEPVIFWEIR